MTEIQLERPYKRGDFHYNQIRNFPIATNFQQYHQENSKFPSNFVKTSLYNAVNYFPLALLKQFKRYANIYFLVIAVIQSIPSISPLSPFVAIAPLVVVLGISIAREGFEDLERHRSDNQLNSTKCTIVNNQQEEEVEWRNIFVGDIIMVKEDQAFPADLVCLGSSYPQGNCYIETGALDGEKNLKPKSSLNETKTIFGPDFQKANADDIVAKITAQVPGQELYQFEGSLLFTGGSVELKDKMLSLNSKQLLLRGAYLRNTEYIYGAVVYTGLDTKIMKNADQGKTKFSDIEINMNKYITLILLFQVLLCILMAILCGAWNSLYDQHWYLQEAMSPGANGVLRFFTYFILLNTMIPISLIVSLELVKMAQSYFISKDEDMYVKAKDRYPQVMTSTINEELGQVEYVFSDKTGTLTCNVMQFKHAVIGKQCYGQEVKDMYQSTGTSIFNKRSSILLQHEHYEKELKNTGATIEIDKKEKDMSEFVFQDKDLTDLLENKAKNSQVDLLLRSKDKKASYPIKDQYALACEYFTLFATTHECLVSRNKEEKDQTNLIKCLKYGGPSPDEITLVDAAKHMNFIYLGTSGQTLELQLKEKKKNVLLLNSFEFDSTRKRMSIIIYDEEFKIYKMYMKGADSIMIQRFSPEQPFLAYTNELLTKFSVKGLRTLMMGMKILSQQEFDQFKSEYNALANSTNREVEQNNLADKIEKDFTLIGASAVEDKLQDNVPETIADLIRANIKVWMLTGDKLETAENIAKSCKLIQADMGIMKIEYIPVKTIEEKDQEESKLKERMKVVKQQYDSYVAQKKKKSFLVEGEALAVILKTPELTEEFVSIAKFCESVICCRVTPKQKASVVKLIKEREKKITLAIGDGANDVNMIQEAQIGCGIYGNEGMRAVQSSDFAFGEFQCLWRLLLVHGRWSYIRISEMIVYFFYKNMVFTIPQFYFAFYCAYSGQTIFDDYYITLYNLCFTALPLMARGIFEQDLNFKNNDHKNIQQSSKISGRMATRQEYVKDKYPLLYTLGQQKRMFSLKRFLIWAFQGLVHGILIFFFCIFIFGQDHIFTIDGHENDLWSLSLAMFTAVIIQVDIKLSIYTQYWTIFHYIALSLTSILLYIVFLIGTTIISSSKVYSTPIFMLSGSHFYLAVFLCSGTLFIVDYLIFIINRHFRDIFFDKKKTPPFDNLLLRKFLLEDPTLDKHLKEYEIFDDYNILKEQYQKGQSKLNDIVEQPEKEDSIEKQNNHQRYPQKSNQIPQKKAETVNQKDIQLEMKQEHVIQNKQEKVEHDSNLEDEIDNFDIQD